MNLKAGSVTTCNMAKDTQHINTFLSPPTATHMTSSHTNGNNKALHHTVQDTLVSKPQ